LDVITNDILKMALRFTGKVGVLASEEEDRPVSTLLSWNDNRSAIEAATLFLFLCCRVYLFIHLD
jgi:hypothetical protein